MSGQTYGKLNELPPKVLERTIEQEVRARKQAGKDKDSVIKSINSILSRESPAYSGEAKKMKPIVPRKQVSAADSSRKFKEWVVKRNEVRKVLNREANIQYRGTGK